METLKTHASVLLLPLTGSLAVLQKSREQGNDCSSTMVFSGLIALTVILALPLKLSEGVELKEVKLGETVVLMCKLSFYSEIHWLRMSEGELMALMATKPKHTGELSVVWSYNETHFEGFTEKQMTGLRILNVSTSDLATYYCATSYQNHLNFDKGVQLHTSISGKVLHVYTQKNVMLNTTFDQVQGPNGLSLHYQVFITVLCFGLLVMIVVVFVVHMKTRKQNTTTSNEE